MALLISNGVGAIDVVLIGPEPVGVVRLDLKSGLTVLYGANGAGKSTLLAGIESAFTGIRRDAFEARLRCRLLDYDGGWGTQLLDRLAEAVRPRQTSPDEAPSNAEWLSDLREDQHSEEVHEILVRTVRDAIAVAAAEDHQSTATEYDITLVAVGTPTEPRYDVYLSRFVDDLTTYKEFVEGIPNFRRHHFPRLLVDLLTLAEADTPGPVCVARLGSIVGEGTIRCVTGGQNEHTDDVTASFLAVECSTDGAPDLLEWCDGDDFDASDRLNEAVSRVQRGARSWCAHFTGSDRELTFRVNHPNNWPEHGLGAWVAVDRYGQTIPVRQLGSAQRRWCSLAIEMSLQSGDGGLPVIAIIDEPENALHPADQKRLSESFEFVVSEETRERFNIIDGIELEALFVATHSPTMMATPDAMLHHVGRHDNGHLRIDRIDSTDSVDALVNHLGVGPADVLLMTRTFLVVEGEHDRIVFETLFHDELIARRARILPLRGAKQAPSLFDAKFLLSYTDAKIVVVLDRVGRGAEELWNNARSAADHDIAAAQDALSRLAELPGGEATWIAEAGKIALRLGALERFILVGLERPDIVDYLPVNQFVADAASWECLRDEHQTLATASNFKIWLQKARNAKIDVTTIRAAAELVDDYADLTRVVAALA